MKKVEVQKELLKNKNIMAKFSDYVSGNLYYTVELSKGTFRFPISTIQNGKESGIICQNEKCVYITLSNELGTTSFYPEMKGSELNRWIGKAIDSEEFIKIN